MAREPCKASALNPKGERKAEGDRAAAREGIPINNGQTELICLPLILPNVPEK